MAAGSVSIENLIEVTFDKFQRSNEDGSELDAKQHQSPTNANAGNKNIDFDCAALREQLLKGILSAGAQNVDEDLDMSGDHDNHNVVEDIQEEIIETMTQIMDATLANVATNANNGTNGNGKITTTSKSYANFQKSSIYDSVMSIFHMMAHFTCSRGDGTLANIVIEHLGEFSCVDMECIRALICDYMKLCLGYLYRGVDGDATKRTQDRNYAKIWKAYEKHVNKKKDVKMISLSSIDFLLGKSGTTAEEDEFAWREECAGIIKDVLELRLTDKSQMVRQCAIEACGSLFHMYGISRTSGNIGVMRGGGGTHTFVFDNAAEDADTYGLTAPELHEGILQQLKWNMAHDPSFANRSMALKAVPIVPETISDIVERVRDSKLHVRVEALDILQRRIDVVKDLSVDQRVDVLKSGLSSRYPATYHATTKMLCCTWMKCMKFDIVDTLDLLDPSFNEEVCMNAARAIIAAASDDFQSTVSTSSNKNDNKDSHLTTTSDVTLAALSNPEIREYKDKVLKAASISLFVDQEGESTTKNELRPSTVVYLRTMCDLILQSNQMSDVKKSTELSKIVPDVTVLCDVLQKNLHILNDIRMEVDVLGEDDDVTDEALETFERKEDAQCFVCLHLLKLANFVDLTEEGSRRHFSSMIHRILCDSTTHEGLVEGSVHALAASHENEASFLISVSEILANVIDSGDDSDAGQSNDDDEEEEMGGTSREDKKEQYLRGIEILSVAFEKTSRKMSANAILKNFSSIILSAITDASLGRLVREAGVGCLGRYVILMDEETIIETFKPLLLEIAFSQEEKIEIRAQAMLAICDLTFLFERMLAPVELENVCNGSPISVSDLLFKTLSCPKNKSLAIVAAECSTKLLFASKLHDANILAHLVAMYFDKDLVSEEFDDKDDAVKEVGSTTRLQQLLTIFFPAYSMSSKISREILLASFKPLLSIIHEKMSVKVKGRRRALTFPVAKMVEYICHNVENAEDLLCGERSGDADVNEGNETDIVNENKVDSKEKEGTSPVLMAAIEICGFLNKYGDDITTTYLRSLCKILSKSFIDIEREDSKALRILKSELDDLAMSITDDSAFKSLEILMKTVADVESDDEGSKASMESSENIHDNSLDTSQVELGKEMSFEACSVSDSVSRESDSESETMDTIEKGDKARNELPSFAMIGDQNVRDKCSDREDEESDEEVEIPSSSSAARKGLTKQMLEIDSPSAVVAKSKEEETKSKRNTRVQERRSNVDLPAFASVGSGDYDDESASFSSSSSSNDSFSSYGNSDGDSD